MMSCLSLTKIDKICKGNEHSFLLFLCEMIFLLLCSLFIQSLFIVIEGEQCYGQCLDKNACKLFASYD